MSGFTGPKRDIIRLLTLGYTRKEIAGRLGVVVKTVDRHLTVIHGIGISDVEIARYAVREGIVRLSEFLDPATSTEGAPR